MEDLLSPVFVGNSIIEKHFSKQKFYCSDYLKLSNILAKRLYEKKYVHDLFTDWTHLQIHPLIFNICATTRIDLEIDMFDFLIHYFNNVFMKVFEKHICLSKFKILLSMRRNHDDGMHIHVLNVQMSHDDYVHLCNLMTNECEYISEDYYVKLCCDSRWCLVGSSESRHEDDVHVPLREYYFEKLGNYVIRDGKYIIPNSENEIEMASNMMPISKNGAHISKFLYYPTRITRDYDMACAKFTSGVNNLDYFIKKENTLKEGKYDAFCYDFLKQNAKSIMSFDSSNSALNTWYNRECFFTSERKSDLGMLDSIDDELRRKCHHLKDVDSPLSTVLKSEYYYLPVFYALCNLTKNEWNVETLIDKIYEKFPVFHEFPNHLPEESIHLNFDTILYCANKTPSPKKRTGFYYTFMEEGWSWIFESTETLEDLKHHVLAIQKKFYPTVKCLKDQKLYSWESAMDKWLPINEIKLKKIIQDICQHMKYFSGICNLSKELNNHLKSDDWIEIIVQHILDDTSNVAEGNLIEMTEKTFDREVYGWNVPQYYFFNYVTDYNDFFK